jgi:hypothetical protein
VPNRGTRNGRRHYGPARANAANLFEAIVAERMNHRD